MPDYRKIYASQAEAYQHMVDHEDYQGNLLAALQRICPLDGLDVVEFGAGTGRVTVMLAPLVRSIHAFDRSSHMLEMAAARLRATECDNWQINIGENARLPVADDTADLAIEGWSFGHLTGWHPQTWPQEVGRVLAEMVRVLRPGGTAIILETLGTGNEEPKPPSEGLAEFYGMLEAEHGFSSTWIRTDYRFPSPQAAADATRFFFEDELADWLLAEQRVILPECTGIWWRQF